MKANEIVKTLMADETITQGDLTKMLGLKSQSAVSGILNRDMRTSTLVRILSCMEGEVIVRDKNGREFVISE